MANETTVATRFGNIAVREDSRGVTFDAKFDSKAFVVGSERTSVKFFVGKMPTLYDEVTQNGHTFEVQGTRVTSTGKFQVENEQGIWEDYECV